MGVMHRGLKFLGASKTEILNLRLHVGIYSIIFVFSCFYFIFIVFHSTLFDLTFIGEFINQNFYRILESGVQKKTKVFLRGLKLVFTLGPFET
jgi:hypothetical protein